MADCGVPQVAVDAKSYPMRRLGRPPGVTREPNVCKGCECRVSDRLFGEWICRTCRNARAKEWKVRAGRVKPKTSALMPWDVPDRIWAKVAERNAQEAWRYWIETKASKDWLAAYHSKKPWATAKTAADRFRIRYRSDPEFRLKQLLRNYDRKAARGRYGETLRIALKDGQTKCRAAEAAGYTVAELKRHLERQFTKGMNWDRFAVGDIHIDHIIPLSCFDLSNEEQFRDAWSLCNLRPLWKKANLIKSSKRTHLI